MTWYGLFGNVEEQQEQQALSDGSSIENVSSFSPPSHTKEQEVYEKKLFENDLYVWSLLLYNIKND